MGSTGSRHSGHSRGGRSFVSSGEAAGSWRDTAAVGGEVGERDGWEDEEGGDMGKEEELGRGKKGVGEGVTCSGEERRSREGGVLSSVEGESGDCEAEGVNSKGVQGERKELVTAVRGGVM